jgi:hypothetical protein
MEPKDNGTQNPTGSQQVPKRGGRPKGSKNHPRLVDVSSLSPTGCQNTLTTDLMKQRASAEDSQRYVTLLNAIQKDIAIAKNALNRLADNLEIIKRDRLYYAGGYENFGDFCIAEIGSRQQAYRLLGARQVLETLLEAGFKEHDLPDYERLCRAVKKLPVDVQAKVWKIVLKNVKESGDKPTSEDVKDAAADLGIGAPATNGDQQPEDNSDKQENEERQQQSDALVREWEGLAKKLKVGLDRKTLTPAVILRLAAVLTDINFRSQALLACLKKEQGQAPEEQAEFSAHKLPENGVDGS